MTPPKVAAAYRTAYATEPVTAQLGRVESSDEFREWGKIRNILSHRGAPGRVVTLGGGHDDPIDWKLPVSDAQTTIPLDAAGLIRRREWLGQSVTAVISSAGLFVRTHLP